MDDVESGVWQPRFSKVERAELTELGLIESQIDQLQTIALPLARAWLKPLPRLQDVRDELNSLSNSMSSALASMSALLTAAAPSRGRYEALQRLVLEDFEEHGSYESIQVAHRMLLRAYSVVRRAQDSLPKTQRRQATADILPVVRINEALLSGFTKGHSSPLPPYTLHPSASPGSPFRRIVGICYEAMGLVNTDPERAIKKFIAWQRKHSRN